MPGLRRQVLAVGRVRQIPRFIGCDRAPAMAAGDLAGLNLGYPRLAQLSVARPIASSGGRFRVGAAMPCDRYRAAPIAVPGPRGRRWLAAALAKADGWLAKADAPIPGLLPLPFAGGLVLLWQAPRFPDLCTVVAPKARLTASEELLAVAAEVHHQSRLRL
jgi:hypothetical protein